MDCLWQGLELKVKYVALSDCSNLSVNVNLLPATLCLKNLRETGNFRLLLLLYYRIFTHFHFQETKAPALPPLEERNVYPSGFRILCWTVLRDQNRFAQRKGRTKECGSSRGSTRKTPNCRLGSGKGIRTRNSSGPLGKLAQNSAIAQTAGARNSRQGLRRRYPFPQPPAATHYEIPRDRR